MYNHQTRPPANPHPEEKKGLLCGHCVALVTSDHSKTACVLGSTPLGWWIELSSSEVVHSRQRIAQEQSRAPVNVHLNVRGQCGTRVGWWAPVGACWKSLCITFSTKKNYHGDYYYTIYEGTILMKTSVDGPTLVWQISAPFPCSQRI